MLAEDLGQLTLELLADGGVLGHGRERVSSSHR